MDNGLPSSLTDRLQELLEADIIDHDRVAFEYELEQLMHYAYNLGFEDGFNECSET